jgi:DNA topoisomerase IA
MFQKGLHSIFLRVHSWSAGSQESSGTAGQSLDEKELSEAMKETGLGTPATRAAIIEVLLKRGFIVRTGKNLEATE